MKIKEVKTKKYKIRFNLSTGFEILSGINKNPDPFVLKFPSLLDIGIMGHCSNRCDFCYQGDNYQKHMTLKSFKRIISESKNHIMQIALGGRGSPNEHPEFEKMIKFARKNNIVPNYTTSGINLTDNQIKASKDYCGAVAVSMYNQDYTFSSINRLIDSDISTSIQYVLSNKSFDNIIKLLDGEDIWNGRVDLDKLHAIVILLFKPQGRGKNLRDWILSEDNIKKFSDIIKNMSNKKLKFGIGLDSCCMCKISQDRELTNREKLYTDTCEAARMSCYITPDMKLVPCSFGDPSIYGTSIKRKSIKEIWDKNIVFKDFRKQLKKNPEQCPFGL